MKRRLLVPIVFAGVALASGVASANPQYWRDNGLLLEVSADPRDGRDFVQVDATRATSLELRALNDTVTLRGITLRFSDGRAMTHRMNMVQPGQPIMVNLPYNCGAITGVELDYGDPAHRRYDRSPARLQIVPRMTTHFDAGHHYGQYNPHPYGHQPTYTPSYTPSYTPVYTQPRPRPMRPRYVSRPRATAQAGWTIQGSFRF